MKMARIASMGALMGMVFAAAAARVNPLRVKVEQRYDVLGQPEVTGAGNVKKRASRRGSNAATKRMARKRVGVLRNRRAHR